MRDEYAQFLMHLKEEQLHVLARLHRQILMGDIYDTKLMTSPLLLCCFSTVRRNL